MKTYLVLGAMAVVGAFCIARLVRQELEEAQRAAASKAAADNSKSIKLLTCKTK